MSYCSKCGNEILDEAVICPNCGCKIQEISKRHNNGMDIATLILGIIGFLTGWLGIGILFDVIAIILGLVALMKAKKHKAKKGISTAGIIIAAISLAMMLFLMGNPFSETQKPIIVNNYGETEYLSADELKNLYESNAVSFDDKYKGAKITIVDVVHSVESERELTLKSSFDWDVELAFSQDIMKNLKKGDKVRVEGKISSAFVDVEIYDAVISQEDN